MAIVSVGRAWLSSVGKGSNIKVRPVKVSNFYNFFLTGLTAYVTEHLFNVSSLNSVSVVSDGRVG